MSTRGSREIGHLFTIYSANLSMHTTDFPDAFVCPICFRVFHRSAIQSKPMQLDRAHIVPSAIGGRLKTLTCKACNSRQGHLMDRDLVARLRSQDKLAGKSEDPLRGKIIVGEGEVTADIYSSAEKGIRINGLPDLSDPALSKIVQDGIDSGATKFSIKGNLGYKDVPSRVAILGSAYLMMFLYFGYGYIKYDIVKPIRQQLLDPNTETDVLKGIVKLKSRPFEMDGVWVIQEPENLRCFMVVLGFSTKIQRFLGVIFPGFDPDSETIYDRWRSIGEDALRGMESRATFIPRNPEFILNPRAKEVCRAFWKYAR